MADHTGLPVPGYATTQSSEAVQLVSQFKHQEERLLRQMDALRDRPDIDQRWLAIARTEMEKSFSFLNRSVFRPARAVLPEDAPAESD